MPARQTARKSKTKPATAKKTQALLKRKKTTPPVKPLYDLKKVKQVLRAKLKRFNKNLNGRISKYRTTMDELIEKIGPYPVCYLTGKLIDLADRSSYSLDHIIPRRLGGHNGIDNCGLALQSANIAKGGMLYETFITSCYDIIEYCTHNPEQPCIELLQTSVDVINYYESKWQNNKKA